MSIFSSISLSSHLQHGWTGLRAQRETWMRTIPQSEKEKSLEERSAICFGEAEGGSIFLITSKTLGPPLQFLCFCPRAPPAIFFFFGSSYLRQRSWQKEHKQPYSKINTAILYVFTFHSAISICDSLPPPPNCAVPFHREGRVSLPPLYKWTGSTVSALISVQSFLSRPPIAFLLFCYGVHADPFLRAKLWGFIGAGAGCAYEKCLFCCCEKRHVFIFPADNTWTGAWPRVLKSRFSEANREMFSLK